MLFVFVLPIGMLECPGLDSLRINTSTSATLLVEEFLNFQHVLRFQTVFSLFQRNIASFKRFDPRAQSEHEEQPLKRKALETKANGMLANPLGEVLRFNQGCWQRDSAPKIGQHPLLGGKHPHFSS